MSNADAWGLPKVLEFFDTARATSDQVYPSEWIFLRDRLREGMSVLDVGCAQAGFAAVLGEHLRDFTYTGVDINAAMVERARAKFPRHAFHRVPEGDLSVLGGEHYDLVLVLGILHLHETWRDTLAAGWQHTGGSLIFDLRETDGPTLADKAVSYMRMDFHGADALHSGTVLPYIVLNAGDALAEATRLCPGAARISRYGYTHPPGVAAHCPVERIHAVTYCMERKPS